MERHHRERDRYPEPKQMVKVGRCGRRAPRAQSRQERAVTRPPQPNARQRQDQHADARPTDDGAAGIFGNRQVLMEAMQPAHERRTKIDHVERPRGRWIEIDVDEPDWAALDRRRPARHHDHRPALVRWKPDRNRLRAARKCCGGARQVSRRLDELRPRHGVTGGMKQRIEGVVPNQYRARNRDRHQQDHEGEADPAVKGPPKSSQARRLGHREIPATAGIVNYWASTKATAIFLLDTGNYSVDQYLQPDFSSFELL